MPNRVKEIRPNLMLITVDRELEKGKREMVDTLRNLCRQYLEKGCHLILDFQSVNVCPSMVWGNLIVQAKRGKQKGLRIALAGLKPTLSKSADIIGMIKYVEIFPDVEEAIKYFEFIGEG